MPTLFRASGRACASRRREVTAIRGV